MSYLQKYEAEVEQLCGVCAKLAADKYVTGTGGNLAWRLEQNLILITPTQVNKGDIRPADVVFIDAAGNTVEGTKRPTGERPMYLKFFRERPDVVTVLHCHPPCVCAFAITTGKNWLERPLFPETSLEVGPAPIVPYAEPLTQRLADNFTPYLERYNSFIMENHGLVMMSVGDIGWTYRLVELLEVSAQAAIAALQLGGIREITRAEVEGLDNIIKTRNLPLPGKPGKNRSLVELYYR